MPLQYEEEGYVGAHDHALLESIPNRMVAPSTPPPLNLPSTQTRSTRRRCTQPRERE